MANSTRDVELIVRAKVEGEKALNAIVLGLKDLGSTQTSVVAGATKTGNTLSRLGQTFSELNKQVEGLKAFAKVVSSLDQAAQAVDRLEGRVGKLTGEMATLTASQEKAAAATLKAKAAAEQAAAAYSAQQAQAAAVRKEAGATSEAYQQQAAALQVAKTERTAANVALRAAVTEEKNVTTALKTVSTQLEMQNSDLAKAQQEWKDLYESAEIAGSSLGGVAAEMNTVSAAVTQVTGKLVAAKDAFANEKAIQDEREGYRQIAIQLKAAADAKTEYARINAALGVHEGPSADLQALRADIEARAAASAEAAKADALAANAAENLKDQLNPLGKIQRDLNADLGKARDLYRAGYLTANELAAAEKLLATNADRAAQALKRQSMNSGGGQGAFLGLKPYELHSLSYQINDVFTQLGSGTPVMQVFAQQGGQVFQVFQRQLIPALERLGPALAAAAPEIAILVAALVALGAALKNIADLAASTKEFAAQLAASADGATYSAEALAETAHQLDVFGGSLADARKELEIFTKAGVNPDLLEKFGRTAEYVAKVTGKDLPAAAKLMADGFTGGLDAIKKLDQEFNFLTAAQLKQIEAMYRGGEGAKANALAYEIFNGKVQKGAEILEGPWGKAMKNFALAWDNLLEAIKNSAVVQVAIDLISKLSHKLAELSEYLPGAQSSADEKAIAGGANPQQIRVERQILDLRKQRVEALAREAAIAKSKADYEAAQARAAAEGRRIAPRYYDPAQDTGKTVAQLDQEIAEAEKHLGQIKESADQIKAEGTEAEKKAQQEVLQQISDQELARKQAAKTTSDADKVRIAGEIAYRQALKETTDEVILQAKRQAAERAELDRQASSVNTGSLADRIIGHESGGRTDAKNPLSSATGLGQFIESTWLGLFRKYYPERAAELGREGILALRKDAQISKDMVELYIKENAASLKAAGVAINDTNLYLAHFLGAGGAAKVLKADPNTPVSQILGADQIAANKKVLEGKTASQVIDFAGRSIGASEADREALDKQADVIKRLDEQSQSYNDTLDQRIKGWQEEGSALAALAKQEGLTLEQKYAAMKAGEIAKAIHQAEGEAIKANTTLSQERRDQITKEAGALYDLKHAEELHNEQLKEKREYIQNVIGLEQQRETALKELNAEVTSGTTDQDRVKELQQQIADLTKQIEEAIPKAREFAAALGDEKAVAALDKVNLKLKTMTTEVKFSKEITTNLVDGLAGAFDNFAQQVAAGVKPITALKNAFLQFASDFLRQIAQMILKQALFNALGVSKDGTSGAGNLIGSIIGSLFHEGGVVGGPSNMSRAVNPAIFRNAIKYHTGGVVGLAPNEVPAILKRNEEVLSESDPRNILNGGGASNGPVVVPPAQVKIVNAIDAGDFVSAGLNTKQGEQSILNLMRNNPGAFKQALA